MSASIESLPFANQKYLKYQQLKLSKDIQKFASSKPQQLLFAFLDSSYYGNLMIAFNAWV